MCGTKSLDDHVFYLSSPDRMDVSDVQHEANLGGNKLPECLIGKWLIIMHK